MPASLTPSRALALLLVVLLVVPAAAGADPAPPAVAQVAPRRQMSVDNLPTAPLTVTVSRIIFTPGASDEGEMFAGPRLVLVESGTLSFHASGDVRVVHTVAEPSPGPTSTPTPVPTPTPARSPTTDVLLGPGDGAPVPIWTMHSLRNDGTVPAVILDVRVGVADAPAPPADLDVETLAEETGLTTLPTGRASIALGQGTVAPGGMVLAPPADVYQLVAATNGSAQVERTTDGSVHNAGTTAANVYVVSIAPAGAAGPRPPAQLATGPGGAEVAFDRVVATHYGPEDTGYWLDEPADPHPGAALATAGPFPVVLFLGGCCQVDAEPYYSVPPDEVQTWLDHLTQRGAIVIYPILRGEHAQEDLAAAMRAAIAELGSGGHAQADWTRFAVIGFSFGGWNAPAYAGVAAAEGLPVPQAILSTVAYDAGTAPDLSAIPASTRVIVLVGQDDVDWGDRGARRLWAALTSVPNDHRDFVRLMSDLHAFPSLFADHSTPSTAVYGTLNALDWYGTWKLGDALMTCAFAGQDCEYALGNTSEQRFMGYWSDGVPVTELEVTDDPGPPDPATPTP
jgi:hypothetical protein